MQNKNKLNLNLILLGLVIASCFSLNISAVKYRWFDAKKNASEMFERSPLSDHDKDYRRGVWECCDNEPEVKVERRGRLVLVPNPTRDQRLEALAEEEGFMKDGMRYAGIHSNAFDAYLARIYGIGVVRNSIACEQYADKINRFVAQKDMATRVAALRAAKLVGGSGGAAVVEPGDDGR